MTQTGTLRNLTVIDAKAMMRVLADPVLYEFTGGEPLSLAELEERYLIQVRGRSADCTQEWLNLIVERGPGLEPVGYVQATIPITGGPAE